MTTSHINNIEYFTHDKQKDIFNVCIYGFHIRIHLEIVILLLLVTVLVLLSEVRRYRLFQVPWSRYAERSVAEVGACDLREAYAQWLI